MAVVARPMVSIFTQEDPKKASDQIPTPVVFTSQIRNDLVNYVHSNMSKNHRQAYGVKDFAGHEYSAESWGTGRAVSRIPRVSGSGTHRAGQGAFGNMCRGGHMFAPNKTWRRWHRKINTEQRRQATASALASSAVPAIVLARGHRVEEVPEIPLVIDNLERLEKTKQVLALLKNFGVTPDLERVAKSKQGRAGKGKHRNRKYVLRRGPLLVYEEANCPLLRAHRNIPGLEACNVHKLNLLQLAPGGTLGRFIIWSSASIKALNNVFGTFDAPSVEKKNWTLPKAIMQNADVQKLLDSDAVYEAFKEPKLELQVQKKKADPYANKEVLEVLNPQ